MLSGPDPATLSKIWAAAEGNARVRQRISFLPATPENRYISGADTQRLTRSGQI
jgi:hypothetical protein